MKYSNDFTNLDKYDIVVSHRAEKFPINTKINYFNMYKFPIKNYLHSHKIINLNQLENYLLFIQ